VTLLIPKRRVDGQRHRRQQSHYLYTVLRAEFTDWCGISHMQHRACIFNSKAAEVTIYVAVLAFAADASDASKV
jgi:ribosomal protein L32